MGTGILVSIFLQHLAADTTWLSFARISSHHSHDETVHVHGDFLMYINDQHIRFTDSKYQTTATNMPHPYLHFHDGDDHIIHRHAEDVLFVDFLASLGYILTPECITADNGTMRCISEDKQLTLYVNDTEHPDILSYTIQDNDQILLYYGDRNEGTIAQYLTEVTDESCIYSGTCPERGIAPPESCGLTCEL